MKTKKTGADGNTANEKSDPDVIVRVLVNGALFNGAHHAAGKELAMPQSKAEVLAGMKPAQVEVIGVA